MLFFLESVLTSVYAAMLSMLQTAKLSTLRKFRIVLFANC